MTYQMGKSHPEPDAIRLPNSKNIHLNPFKLQKRMPGWFPDAIDNTPPQGKALIPGTDVQFLFKEEAVQLLDDKTTLVPFGIPHSEDDSGRDTPFLEPTDSDSWASFNRWILGHKVYPKKANEPGLTTVIRSLADHARIYNASLYRLRRLHFYYKMCKQTGQTNYPTKYLPPHNKNQGGVGCEIPEENLPDLAKNWDDFCELASDAESKWTLAADMLNQYIETGYSVDYTHGSPGAVNTWLVADMMEVNGYIVSFRAIVGTGKPVRGRIHITEVGGSSSQVSVSSAFSSPSSYSMEIRSNKPKSQKPKSRPVK